MDPEKLFLSFVVAPLNYSRATQRNGKQATHRDRGNIETEKTERRKKTERERETERQGEQRDRETDRQNKKRNRRDRELEKNEKQRKRERGGGGRKVSLPILSFFPHSFCFLFWLVPELLN